jgi:hypothetical protein
VAVTKRKILPLVAPLNGKPSGTIVSPQGVPQAPPINPSTTVSPQGTLGNTQTLFGQFSFLTAIGRGTWWQRIGITVLGIAVIWVAILVILANNKKLQSIVIDGTKSAIKGTPSGVAANLATGVIA